MTTAQAVGDSPLYRRVLGPTWGELPPRVRELHDVTAEMLVQGLATVERGTSPLARLIATVLRFPAAGKDVPLTVHFRVRDGVETWTRTFGTCRMVSTQEVGSRGNEHLIVERFGPFAFGLAPELRDKVLVFTYRTWSLWGVPLPPLFRPNGVATEREVDGVFHFDVDIAAPLIGSIVRYRGFLTPREPATTNELNSPARA